MEYFELNDGNKIPAIGFGVFMIPADGPIYEATLAEMDAIRALDTGKGTHDPDDPVNAERLLSFRVHD